jgi:hypothetical protein
MWSACVGVVTWCIRAGAKKLETINDRLTFQSDLRKQLVAKTVNEREALVAEVTRVS